MQNLIDIEEKIFFECQNILESLSKITTQDELLLKQDLCYELTERIAFLKLLEKNKESLGFENSSESDAAISTELQDNEMFIEEDELIDHDNQELEEVIFNNELNEIHTESKDDFSALDTDILNDDLPISQDKEQLVQENNTDNADFEEDDLPIAELMKEEPIVTNEEEQAEELEVKTPTVESESRGKIVEYDKENAQIQEKIDYLEQEPKKVEKKISLVQIKGVKMIESLFDDDPLERLTESNEKAAMPQQKTTENIVESKATTITTAKKPIEFRLDMNDKIAFSKNLFGGSQSEMNETINILNSFETLEQAKEYLSDMYYDKNWDKVDDYAQRLWTLVENKFL